MSTYFSMSSLFKTTRTVITKSSMDALDNDYIFVSYRKLETAPEITAPSDPVAGTSFTVAVDYENTLTTETSNPVYCYVEFGSDTSDQYQITAKGSWIKFLYTGAQWAIAAFGVPDSTGGAITTSGSTTTVGSYPSLDNLPKINGVTLIGDKASTTLNLVSLDEMEDVQTILNNIISGETE